MNVEELAVIATLIRGQRQAALGTLRDGAPFVSMVAYAAEPGFGGFLLHLSRLAPHTRQLLATPLVSLLICERDDGRDDIQTLARITLTGSATPLPSDSADYPTAREHYLMRLPAAAPLFDFPDFALFRLVPDEARYIGGFARIYTLTPDHLRAAFQATEDREPGDLSYEF
jgi:heme oxygenase (biliverdin-IX-beta and delta-forming)